MGVRDVFTIAPPFFGSVEIAAKKAWWCFQGLLLQPVGSTHRLKSNWWVEPTG
jgi:hypothetical protein